MPHTLTASNPKKDFLTGFLTGHLRQFSKGRYPFMKQMKHEHGDFIKFQFGPITTFQVTDLDAVELILKKDARHFSKDTPGFRLVSEVTGKGVFTENGESWLKIRKIVQPFFSKNHHPHWSKIIQELARELVAQIKQKYQINDGWLMSRSMTQIALSVLGRTVFNQDLGHMLETIETELSRLVEITNDRVAHSLSFNHFKKKKTLQEFHQSLSRLDDLIDQLINESKKLPQDVEHNLVHAFLAAPYDINETFLRDQVKTMVFAGHETTSSVLSWTLYLLAKYPEWQTRVCEQINSELGSEQASLETMDKLSELELVVNECMRLYPPSWSLGRICEEDTDLLGTKIKKGDVFIISPYLIHHDEKIWKDAEEFRPERFLPENKMGIHPMSFIPFGAGPRACTGEWLARMEMMIIIPTILQHFTLRLPPGEENKVPDFLISLRPQNGVTLLLTEKRI